MLSEFHFLRPLWLLLLVPLALLLWRLARGDGEADAWRGLVDAHLLRRLLSGDRTPAARLPLLLLGVGWLVLVVALAGPTWQRLPTPLYQAQQYRVIALDLSVSMNATDLKPTRLAHARFEVLDMLRYAGEGQTAMIAYGAEPYVVAPLTADSATIAAQVPLLETGLLPVSGARRADLALALAGELLQQARAPDGEVILVTDGVDDAAAAGEAARGLRAAGYRVSVLGVGTEKGAPIALGGGGFLEDRQGAIVLPRLDTAALDAVAGAGGGRYVTAGPGDRDTALLMRTAASRATDDAEKQDATSDQWREEGPWLVLLLLPLAALAFRRGWLSPMLLLVWVIPAHDAGAVGWDDLWLRADQQAMRELEAGRIARAAELFERPDWRAAAAYQAGEYEAALDSLETQRAPAADYNRGNSLARLGRLEDALASYERALAADPGDADARHNRDLVRDILQRRREAERPPQPPDAEQQRADDTEASDQEQTQQKDEEAADASAQDAREEQGASADPDAAEQQAGGEDNQPQQGQSAGQDEQSEGQASGEQADTGQPQAGGEQQGGASPGSDSERQGGGSGTAGDGGQSDDAGRAGGDTGQAQDEAGGTRAGDSDGQGAAPGAEQNAAGEPRADEQAAADGPAAAGDAAQEPGDGAAGHPDTDAPAQADGDRPGTQPGDVDSADATGPGTRAMPDGGQADAQGDGEQAGGAGTQGEPSGTAEGDGLAGGAPPGSAAGGAGAAATEGPDAGEGTAGGTRADATARQPGLADLLGGDGAPGGRGTRPDAMMAHGDSEDRQALEQMLRRVEDDPGGLLRQRFLLQHLRRKGQLP